MNKRPCNENCQCASSSPPAGTQQLDAPRSDTRRGFLGKLAKAATAATFLGPLSSCKEITDEIFHKHYQQMTPEEVEATLKRIKKEALAEYGKELSVATDAAIPGVKYGYALNIQKCNGNRRCVEACVQENNQSRDPSIQYIRVLQVEKGKVSVEHSEHYYAAEAVPDPGKFYMPVQCQHCDNPPCVAACPVQATWKEPDGIVVVDYDWCIGCRYCAAACPYYARKFNWSDPGIPSEELNTDTHYLSNRPRKRGVMEKCTFCLHRVRKGRYPACLEACPTGARKFGNLLDPDSEIQYILRNKRVFRLKEELNTQPSFWYYMD